LLQTSLMMSIGSMPDDEPAEDVEV
jgi:hypothetical protein